MKKLKILFYSLFVAILFYSLIGFFVLPHFLKKQFSDAINKLYGTRSSIEAIKINPFTFEMKLLALKIDLQNVVQNIAQLDSQLDLEELSINLSPWSIFNKTLYIQEVQLKNTKIGLVLFKNKKSNWHPINTEPAPALNFKDQEQSNPWTLQIEKISVLELELNFLDQNRLESQVLNLGPLSLNATNISTALNSSNNLNFLDLHFGYNGRLQVSGEFGFSPFFARLKVLGESLPLTLANNFLEKETYLKVLKGDLNFLGWITVDDSEPALSGQVAVKNFLIEHAPSKNKFLSFKSLDFENFEFQSLNRLISINQIILSEPSLQITRTQGGSINLANYFDLRQKQKTSTKPADPLRIKVNGFQLRDGKVNFADKSVSPSFLTKLHHISLNVKNITHPFQSKIPFQLKLRQDTLGSLGANGKIMPTSPLFLDLEAKLKNIELSTLSGYSAYGIGYLITKGKINADLNYQVAKNNLKADNRIQIDQFVLGDNVPSPNSTFLPLGLAVSLIQDREGKINFKLPIQGSLNDSQLGTGDLILTALKNLVFNIAAAPFDFLAQSFGSKNDFKHFKFEVASANLINTEQQKLQELIHLLTERPQLKIELQGLNSKLDTELLKKKPLSNLSYTESLSQLPRKRTETLINKLTTSGIGAERLFIKNVPSTETSASVDSGVMLFIKTD